MSDFVKRLHEERLRTWEQAKELLDRAANESRDLSGEEEASYRQMSERMDAIDARVTDVLESRKRAETSDAAFAELLAKPAERPAERGAQDPDAELRSWLKGERGRTYDVRPEGRVDFRTLSKLSAGAGLNTVPTSFYNRLVQHMIENSGVLQAGPTVLTTSGGEALQIPKTTAHSSASQVDEAGQIGASDPTFGQVSLGSYKYAFLIKASHELINDTAVDLMGYLAAQAGRALGNGFGADLVTGGGSTAPNGVATAASAGKTGADAVAGVFTTDDLIDLYYSVIAPYRNSRSCAWMMRDATVAALRKFRDDSGATAGTGNYLWQPGLTAGAPDTLLGKPIVVDPNVAAVAADAKSVLFGDFSTYFVRQVENIRFERSDDFAFDYDLVTFRAILRGDGDQVDTTGAIKAFVGGAAS